LTGIVTLKGLETDVNCVRSPDGLSDIAENTSDIRFAEKFEITVFCEMTKSMDVPAYAAPSKPFSISKVVFCTE
jgi:hypothetical protein